MNPIVLIPARMAATRLPGKPLADIGGVPMIVRVLRQARGRRRRARWRWRRATRRSSRRCARLAAGRCSPTRTCPPAPTASWRRWPKLDPAGRHDVVINLQGDMPFVDPAGVLERLRRLLAAQPACDIATVVAPEAARPTGPTPTWSRRCWRPGRRRAGGRALYFTRSTLYGDGPVWRHIGIYGYRRAALERFCAAPPSPLEQREKLEQLRALELGLSIWAAVVDNAPISVDNPADLEAARGPRQEP